MLDFVDKTFNQMAFTIQPLILLTQDFSALMRWNNGFNTLLQQIGTEVLCRIATISKQAVKIEAFQQMISLGDGMALTSRQRKTQGVAQAINRDMDFATEATATASQGLLTAFFRHPPRKDAPAQSCYQSSPFPYQDHPQSIQASLARHPLCTSAQSVCKSCSICRIQQAIIAIVRHCGSPI